MATDDREARGKALLAELEARGMSRAAIEEHLVDAGYSPDEATDLVEGVSMEVLPPPPTIEEVVDRAARELLAEFSDGQEGGVDAGESLDRGQVSFWEALLGGPAEARSILARSDIAAAIASGDGLALHRLLWAERRRPRSKLAAERLEAVLRKRRLFVTAGAEPPRSLVLWGIGVRFMCRRRRAVLEGTAIGSRHLIFAHLPILPLESILVAPVQGGGLHAIGRVPRSRSHVWWLRLAGVAFAALLLWAITSRIA